MCTSISCAPYPEVYRTCSNVNIVRVVITVEPGSFIPELVWYCALLRRILQLRRILRLLKDSCQTENWGGTVIQANLSWRRSGQVSCIPLQKLKGTQPGSGLLCDTEQFRKLVLFLLGPFTPSLHYLSNAIDVTPRAFRVTDKPYSVFHITASRTVKTVPNDAQFRTTCNSVNRKDHVSPQDIFKCKPTPLYGAFTFRICYYASQTHHYTP